MRLTLDQVLEWKLEKLLKEGVNSYNCEPYSTIIRFCGETRNAALAMRVGRTCLSSICSIPANPFSSNLKQKLPRVHHNGCRRGSLPPVARDANRSRRHRVRRRAVRVPALTPGGGAGVPREGHHGGGDLLGPAPRRRLLGAPCRGPPPRVLPSQGAPRELIIPCFFSSNPFVISS